jgi:enoyl-CoA hydratase/carnithine racemase
LNLDRVERVLVITLDRADQMNALSSGLIAELQEAIIDAATDDTVHAVVLTGSGPAFSAGADLKEALVAVRDPATFRATIISWRDAFRAIELCPKPVIAGLNGTTIAGGLELALACDVIVAARGAHIGDGHIKYGLVPGGGGSQRLPDAIGTRAARWLMYTGTLLDAEAARALGLVQHVIDDDTFRDDLIALALQLSRSSLPALAFMKRQTTSPAVTIDGLDLEIEAAVHVVTGADAKEGLAAFTERRAPRFPAVHAPSA